MSAVTTQGSAIRCPICGHATATMPHPMAFIDPTTPVLRYCTNEGGPEAMFDACVWERPEELNA